MTYRSLRIYRYPTGDDFDLEQGAAPLVQETGGPHVGHVSVVRWAKDRGLEIAWVDNCWARVPVSRDQVISFLIDHTDPVQISPPTDWADRFLCDRYVIEEEEF